MKAFLSHSSKDKPFVEDVAKILGTALCEYDEYTFEYILNAKAIRNAFMRCDLFVFFLSENSINSSFVSEELRTALDFRAQGQLKKVMVIALDQTSFKALPEWMRAINVATHISTPQTCGRKIEAELIALDAEAGRSVDIYTPRPDAEADIRKALSKPPGIAPVAIHIVGQTGIGRRTFIRKMLSGMFPRQIQTFVPIPFGRYDGPNEIYRQLYGYFIVSSVEEKRTDFERFAQSTEDEQVDLVANLLAETVRLEECVIIEDAGGVLTDEGSYQSFIEKAIKSLAGSNRPVVAFSQQRMMNFRFREQLKEGYFTFLNPLDENQTRELCSFSLRNAGVDFSEKQLDGLCELLDGHPINVKLAVSAIKSYGLQSFLAEPSLLIELKRKRAEDFLSQINFSQTEIDILSMLVDFTYLPFEFIRANIGEPIEVIADALRKLEDYCCIERRSTLYAVSAPIQGAASRDKRFRKPDRWRSQIAEKLLHEVSSYRDSESITVAVIDAAAKAAIISGKFSGIASAFILPSHYLNLAREAYKDDSRRKDCIQLCKKAFAIKSRLSIDGNIELLRLWGLSAIRLSDEDELETAMKELEAFKTKRIAKRHWLFLRGFKARLKKRYDDAEIDFLAAHKLSPKNLSINRELASLYRHQGDFVEAEGYARDAYEVDPTNPFVLDVLIESLLGKSSQGLPVDHEEIGQLFDQLRHYGDVPGSSFYQARIAQDLFRQRKKPEALSAANAAIARTPSFLPCYYLRADIRLSVGDKKGARDDFQAINAILDRRGGFSEDDEGRVHELEVKLLTYEKQYKLAKEKLYLSQFLPKKVRHSLAKLVATAISFEPSGVDAATKRWAHSILK